jgi:hypothetical protein
MMEFSNVFFSVLDLSKEAKGKAEAEAAAADV